MAGLIVTMAATRLRLFVQTAHCRASTSAGMAVIVLRLGGFVMEILIALTAPMSLTLGQTALCMHKTTPFHARDSRGTLQKYVMDFPVAVSASVRWHFHYLRPPPQSKTHP